VSKSIPHDIIVTPEDEPLVLTGPPSLLAGEVELFNSSDVDVVLRDVALLDTGGVLVTLPPRQSLPTVVLRPHQGRRVPLSIAVDPTTPPGDYAVELTVGGDSRPVVLHVTEFFELTVQPEFLVVLNRHGEAQRRRLFVTNDGNVAFAIGDIGDVDLEDDMIAQRSARVALEPLAQVEHPKGERPVLALVQLGRADEYITDGLSVRAVDGTTDLAPGETTAIELEITVRKELPKNRRFRGRAPLLTHNLEIVVVSDGDSLNGKTPRRAHSRHRKPGGGATT
jgi:hypothetical protein